MKTQLNFAVLTGIVASTIVYREPSPGGSANEAAIPVIKNEGEQYECTYFASDSSSPSKHRT
jgi:hypothetical protein